MSKNCITCKRPTTSTCSPCRQARKALRRAQSAIQTSDIVDALTVAWVALHCSRSLGGKTNKAFDRLFEIAKKQGVKYELAEGGIVNA